MSEKSYFLGIDVSTTSSKALLMDAAGRVVQVASAPHTLQTPKLLWSEQDPGEWWQAVQASIRAVLRKAETGGDRIAALGLTGQMHGLVLLDKRGNVLRPAILWNDQRTQSQCAEIHERIGKERFLQISGNLALTGFTAPKIMWVQENEPQVYAQVKQILLPKDYIRYCLTGEFATDKAGASGSALFDLNQRDWSGELLDALGINPGWMPPTHEGPAFTGAVSAEAAEQTGLRQGTPVAAGGGDQSAQAVGVGAVEAGIVALTLGTSGVVFATTPGPFIEPEGRLHAFCHAVPQRWHLMGVMLSAAGSLQWYRDALAPEMGFDELTAEAGEAPAGSEGLQFLPYLSGERTPHADPLARGAWVGLTRRHNRSHMTRALLEGVAYGLKDSFELIQQSGLSEIRQVRVSGGGAKSALWREILASVLEAPLVTVENTEGAAYGAALLAAIGAGAWQSAPQACRAVVRTTEETQPNPAWLDAYRQGYTIYQGLYPQLKQSFQKMG